MFKRVLIFGWLVLCSINLVSAQESGEGWPIIKRCVPVTSRPSNWMYSGVILATGWAGLHGIRASLDKPYVVAFIPNMSYNGGYKLSPDGHWYVVAQATFIDGPLFSDSIEIDQLKIYSTIDRKIVLTIPWNNEIGGPSDARPLNKIFWLDNEHLVTRSLELGNVLLNPFTNEIRPLAESITLPQEAYIFYPSPDWSHAIFNTYRLSPDWQLNNIINGTMLFSLETDRNAIADWANDSSKFVLQIGPTDAAAGSMLTIFDTEGQQIATLIVNNSADTRPAFDFWNHGWSPDDNYFAFVPYFYQDDFEYEKSLFIADIEGKRIIDTCLRVDVAGLAWSPDSTMLAFSEYNSSNNLVRVFDLKSWQSYTVAYHNGPIIGWRD